MNPEQTTPADNVAAVLQHKYETLLKKSPGSAFSTIFFLVLRWLFRIPGFLLVLAGIIFLAASAMHEFLLKNDVIQFGFSVLNEEGQEKVLIAQAMIGIIVFLLGLHFLFVAGLCIRIVKRSNYINELEGVLQPFN